MTSSHFSTMCSPVMRSGVSIIFSVFCVSSITFKGHKNKQNKTSDNLRLTAKPNIFIKFIEK